MSTPSRLLLWRAAFAREKILHSYIPRLFLTFVLSFFALGQSLWGANQSADLDQAHNGQRKPTVVSVSPVTWENGNAGSQDSHYIEGHSVPYRMMLDNLDTSATHTLDIEWDIRDG